VAKNPAYKPDKDELERFFGLSLDMLCIAGFDGYFKLVNPVWEKTLGFTVDEMLSRPFEEFLHPDDREPTATNYAEQMAQGRDSVEFENRYLCKDGSYKWLLWNAKTLQDDRLIYAVARDISERKRMDRELLALNESLDSRVRERTRSLTQANRKLRAQIKQRQRAEQEVRLLQSLTVAISEASDIDAALTEALRKLCEATGWAFGQAWLPSANGAVMERNGAWYRAAPNLAKFRKASQRYTFEPGVGLPGRVWKTRQPAWVRDVTVDPNFPRATAATAAGFKSALAVPILAGAEVVAVIEFFQFQRRKSDQQLIELVSAVAAQLGSMVQRKRAEETARYLAHFDPVTELPNRALLKDRLNVALAQARGHGQPLALLYLGLDGFSLINDTAGHSAGDQLLDMVGANLRSIARHGDTVARVGGDEFAVLATAIERVEDAASLAGRVLESISGPRTLGAHDFHVSASLGITIFPADGDHDEILLNNAQIAMHQAKEQGGDGYRLYEPAMNERMLRRLSLENGIRRALKREEFEVYYQPQVDAQSGRVVGAEALVRWNDPDRGLVSPGEFIPLAEESGLITDLGDWVLRAAVAQNKAWEGQGLPPLRVSVNVAARQMQEAKLIGRVAQILSHVGLDHDRLELEITEASFITNTATTIALLHQFREMGVRASLDDFGTGYSSLSYLKNLPLDTLKIDQSFVSSLGTDPSGAAITAAIIAMAHALDLKVIAEGVETEHQLQFLKQRRCDELQGFLFGEPMPATDFAKALTAAAPRNGRRVRVN
jgi:diguanylate cyclase (GGDEF)-like protein/PAS domain S-box-containing protein